MENQEVYKIEPGVKEIEITHRKGLDAEAPLLIDITGNIDSVFNWLNKRTEINDKRDSHIIVNRDEMSILLVFNETDPHYQGMVKGQLTYHPDFEKWKINEGKGWNHDELAEFIKMNRSCFKSKNDAMKLSGELKNLKIKVDKEVEASNDNRGNVKVLAAQTVIDSSIPKSFLLNVPVFKGQDKQEFEVEVYVNPNNFQVTLVSPDANDIKDAVRDNIINEEIEKIEQIAPNIPIIKQ